MNFHVKQQSNYCNCVVMWRGLFSWASVTTASGPKDNPEATWERGRNTMKKTSQFIKTTLILFVSSLLLLTIQLY